jgi:hypothetical protein
MELTELHGGSTGDATKHALRNVLVIQHGAQDEETQNEEIPSLLVPGLAAVRFETTAHPNAFSDRGSPVSGPIRVEYSAVGPCSLSAAAARPR